MSEVDPDDAMSVDPYNYHDMLYYAFVTMTTVGYGDICPTTFMGRALFVCFALCMILVIPSYFQDLTKVNSLTSEYGRIMYTKTSKETQHILLMGDSQPDAIKTFLKECFHSDHGAADVHVIILRSVPPTEEFNIMLNDQ